jgi:hypothetical protein
VWAIVRQVPSQLDCKTEVAFIGLHGDQIARLQIKQQGSEAREQMQMLHQSSSCVYVMELHQVRRVRLKDLPMQGQLEPHG